MRILAILFLLLPALLHAADTFSLAGYVKNRLTDTDLLGAHVRLLSAADSTVCAETDADAVYYTGSSDSYSSFREVHTPLFRFGDIDKSKKYILELTREDFETLYVDIDPATLSNRSSEMHLGSLYMKRKAKMLDEVVVKASKVMFYNKGDTIVYNADAFVLAEGSMLDALISQMPGVELKPGGDIYVNGRYVEALLLNGKDFFNGNRQMMLENLGAYTVKNIAVYEKQDEMDKIMGEGYGRKKLSMDVRLKKEYNQGLLSNVEVGYGTNDRYLGRLFGLWYADNARLSIYGSANNLSDKRKPGQDTGFTPGGMKSGSFKTYQGGLDYWAKIPFKNVEFHGEAVAAYESVDDDRSVLTTNFLPGGDTYGYSYTKDKTKSFSLSTSHTLDINKSKWNMKVNPSFAYRRNNDLSGIADATFSQEWQDMGKDFIENLYKGASADVLASILNRNLNNSKRLGHDIDARFFSNGKFKVNNGTDAITYLVQGQYRRQHYDRFQKYVINFGSEATPAAYYDRYFDNTPNYNWSATGAVGYIWNIKDGLYLDSWYQYDHTESREVSDLYRLDNLLDSVSADKPLGYLPSAWEYESTIDPQNSYDSRKREDINSINFDLNWNVKGVMNLRAHLPVVHRHQFLHYVRGNVNSAFGRNRLMIGDANVEINCWPFSGWMYITYKHSVASPNLVDMVDFKDDLDPLNVKSGNPGLKDSENHSFNLNYTRRTKQNRIMQSYGLEYTLRRNALAYGYNYDSSTGVRSGKMYNVNGNYYAGVSQGFRLRFGPTDIFTVSNSTEVSYARSVDLLSENASTPSKNKVGNTSLDELVKFEWDVASGSALSLFGQARVSHFDSKQANFRNFTAQDYNYGLRGNFRLPAGFGLSTDFTVYTRRGYSDPALNKTNFVWNARASYTILNGRLIFMVDGFDILHNLSNVFYSVNAQARTETYTNVLPRYVMLHVQWRLHKAPKKK